MFTISYFTSRVFYSFIFLITPLLLNSQSLIQPKELVEENLFGLSLEIDGNWLMARSDLHSMGNDSKVHTFQNINGTWKERDILTSNSKQKINLFGGHIDIDKNDAIISSRAQLAIFELKNNEWIKTDSIDNSKLQYLEHFSFPSALSKGTIALSDFRNSEIYIFRKEKHRWVKETIISNETTDGYFGKTITLYDNKLIATTSNSNYLYYYERVKGKWIEKQKIQIDEYKYRQFPIYVDMHENRLLVGAQWDRELAESAGAVYIYKLENSLWELEQKLVPSEGHEYQRFGIRGKLNKDYAVIRAASINKQTSGIAYVFKRKDSIWNEVAKYTGSDNDNFASLISISDSKIAVSAPSADIKGQDFGAVYTYELPQKPQKYLEQSPITLSIYPVPDQEDLKIIYRPTKRVYIEKTHLASVNGKYSKTWKKLKSPIDLTDLPEGFYRVSIRNGSGSGHSKLIYFKKGF